MHRCEPLDGRHGKGEGRPSEDRHGAGEEAEEGGEGEEGGKSDDEAELAVDICAWSCRATSCLEAVLDEDALGKHRSVCRAALARNTVVGSSLLKLKSDFLDIAVAAPLPVDARGDLARGHWLPLIKAASTCQQLGELLTNFVRLLPRDRLNRASSFKAWWPGEGDKEPPPAQADTAHQVTRPPTAWLACVSHLCLSFHALIRSHNWTRTGCGCSPQIPL